MKNVFCFVVDAMSALYLYDEYKTTPFINKLAAKSHNCTNIFSQGPYTEAALTPMYTGRDNMDLGGNFFRGNEAKKTIFEAFDEKGYDVLNYTQPLIYPKTMHRGINQERYGVAYFFSAVYDYRISYYVPLYKNSELTERDYERLYELLDSNFEFWLKYLNDCKNKEPVADFVNLYGDRNYDFAKNIARVEEEYKNYIADKKAYLHSLFELGSAHPVFSIEKYDMSCKADNEQLYLKIEQRYKDFFKKLERFNKSHNKGTEHDFVHTSITALKHLFRGKPGMIYDELKKFRYYLRFCDTEKCIKELFDKKSNYKPEPSFLKYFSHFEKWYSARETENPFFCLMHVSDLHIPEIFFSIDSESIEELDEELRIMSDYLDSLPEKFEGNVIYNLSMRYVDLCLEKIYDKLQKMNLLEDTLVIITADHGSSFRYNPIRESVVNNNYIENYSIPCLIYNEAEISPHKDVNYYTTKDLIKTIARVADVDADDFTGISMLEESDRKDFAIVEYLGGGCPDINRRPLWMIIRNDRWTVGIRQRVDAPFDESNIVCIYDRISDPKEKNNLCGKISVKEIEYLHNALKNRFERICEQNY